MIFLTIGSHEPFDRLVRAVDHWVSTRPEAKVFGQITGPSPEQYLPQNFPWVAKLSAADYQATVAGADFLVAHAGMGSIISALMAKKPIVVLPRRGHMMETRNDHQFATVARLRAIPGIFVALTEDDLPAQMDAVWARHSAIDTAALSPFADERLISALRETIMAG